MISEDTTRRYLVTFCDGRRIRTFAVAERDSTRRHQPTTGDDRGAWQRRPRTRRRDGRSLRRKVSARYFRGTQRRECRRARVGIRGLTRSRIVGCRTTEILRYVRGRGLLTTGITRSRGRKWWGGLPGWETGARRGVE